ncbi:hypothetical protein VitviT2T_005418 [Vitis vinifera]|uniref:F-box domain-containing protein n=1 Tax=Vitis vinifera TaxID=29760 RepID=A0ABY9BSJ4_VITVI|nr:hypothetical protein VitviT2T_005418 [Vitis vinifera]
MSGRVPITIPLDLIIEILTKLPIKSLIRFQCISKLWRSMISDPSFIDLHRTPFHYSARWPRPPPLLLEGGVPAGAAFQRRLCQLTTARSFADFQHRVELGRASPASNAVGCRPVTVVGGRHLGVTRGGTSGASGEARRGQAKRHANNCYERRIEAARVSSFQT